MSDEFTVHVFRIIIAHAAQEKGFTTISEVALEILVDAAIDRLSEIARSAARITTHCGRTDTNGLDVFAALFKFQETPDSLSQFLCRPDQFPPFEFLVEPYPLPSLPRFYPTGSAQTTYPTLPFRANTTFIPSQSSRHIPPFFPPPPNRYTYDQGIASDPPVPDDPEIVKRREDDQNRIKRALIELSAGKGVDSGQTVKFDCELTRLIVTDMFSRPAPLLESPIYQLEGIRGSQDPEFLPLTDVTDAIVTGEPTRDTPFMLSILSIRQGQTEPGTLKNATYSSQGTVEKERTVQND